MFSFSSKVKQEEESSTEEETGVPDLSPWEPAAVKREVEPPDMDDEDTILNDDPEIQLKPFAAVLEDSSTLDAFESWMQPLGDDSKAADTAEDVGILCAQGQEGTNEKKLPVGTVMKTGRNDTNLTCIDHFGFFGVNHQKKGCPLETAGELPLEGREGWTAREEPTAAKTAGEAGSMAAGPLPVEEDPVKTKFRPWGRVKLMRALGRIKPILQPRRSGRLNSQSPYFMSAASMASMWEPGMPRSGQTGEATGVRRRQRKGTQRAKWKRVKQKSLLVDAAPGEPVEPPSLLCNEERVAIAMGKGCQQAKRNVSLHRKKKMRRKATLTTTVPNLEEEPTEPPPILKIEEPSGIQPVKRRYKRRTQGVLLKSWKRKRLETAVVNHGPALDKRLLEPPPLLEIEKAPGGTQVKRKKRRTRSVLMSPKRRRTVETVAVVEQLAPIEEVVPAEEASIEPPKKRGRKASSKSASPAGKGRMGRPPKRIKQTLSSDTRVEASAHSQTLMTPRIKQETAAATLPSLPPGPMQDASSSCIQPQTSSSNHSHSTSCCCHHQQQPPQGNGLGAAASVGAVFAQLFEEEIRQLADGKGYVNMTVDIYEGDRERPKSTTNHPTTSSGRQELSKDTAGSAASSARQANRTEGPARGSAGAASSHNSLSILSDVDLCVLLKGRILSRGNLVAELRDSMVESLEQMQKILVSQQRCPPSPQPPSDAEDDILLETDDDD